MRIIITKNGQRIIRKLSSSKSTPELFNNPNKSPEIKDKDNPLLKNYYSIQSSAKSQLPNISSSNNSLLFSSNNNIKVIKPKQFTLKKKNLRIPLTFLKRFEKNYEQNNIIVSPINILSTLENKNENSSNASNSYISSSVFLPRIKSSYSIREIMPKSSLENFDNKLKEKLDEEKYDVPLENKILRNDWSGRNIFKEFDNKKNKQINSRNYKLIEYLMDKKTLSQNFLDKINQSDEKKMMVLDKLSGKVLEEKENQKIFDKRMKERIENKKIKEGLEFRKMLLDIKTKVNDNIKDDHMNKYILVKDNNKAVYRNVFKKFRRKYWKKSDNFSRYFHQYQKVHFEEI
jgi:hypothetical protein